MPRSWIPHSLWQRRAGLPTVRHLADPIELGVPLELAEGLLLLRLPLPFALNHVNVYLVEDGDGWTLVDCGLDTPAARQIWSAVLDGPRIGSRPVRQIIVTHHHPDHVGLAGWLAARCDAPVRMTPLELKAVQRYADPQRDAVAERAPLWHEHGLAPDVAKTLLQHMPRYAEQVHRLPERVEPIDVDTVMQIGGRTWRPLIGRGHSPQHLSLLADDGSMMIGGDQVLPKITPNIAVWPGGDADPLRSYLDSLQGFEALDEHTLLLPSHKQPLWGIASRVEQIRRHHDERLDAVMVSALAASGPLSAYQLLPALFGRALVAEEIGFGLGEAIAHLNFLESEGALSSAVDGQGHRRFRCSEPIALPEHVPSCP